MDNMIGFPRRRTGKTSKLRKHVDQVRHCEMRFSDGKGSLIRSRWSPMRSRRVGTPNQACDLVKCKYSFMRRAWPFRRRVIKNITKKEPSCGSLRKQRGVGCHHQLLSQCVGGCPRTFAFHLRLPYVRFAYEVRAYKLQPVFFCSSLLRFPLKKAWRQSACESNFAYFSAPAIFQ